MSKPLYLIGVGSPFGADSLGWLLCERLFHSSTLQEAIAQRQLIIEICRQPANLVHYFQDASGAIVVDALQGDNPYGTVLTLTPTELETAPIRLSSHGFGLNDAIGLANMLGVLPATTLIVGMDVNTQVDKMPEELYLQGLQRQLEQLIQTHLD